MYAIVETGGKQVRVEPGQRVQVEKLPVEVGSEVVFERVLLAADPEQGRVEVGQPQVKDARVIGKALAQGRGKKIYVVKFHSKNNYRRRTGHRQPFTEVLIDRIEWAGVVATASRAQRPQEQPEKANEAADAGAPGEQAAGE
ncbi:MAG: 50S ribosomal protein L21 [Limnochordaceae bacterium]|nr:50S ribosomal protein L21 [Limnochordaceae bacterium]